MINITWFAGLSGKIHAFVEAEKDKMKHINFEGNLYGGTPICGMKKQVYDTIFGETDELHKCKRCLKKIAEVAK